MWCVGLFIQRRPGQVKHVQKHTFGHARNSVDANVGVKECRYLWGEGAGEQVFLGSTF